MGNYKNGIRKCKGLLYQYYPLSEKSRKFSQIYDGSTMVSLNVLEIWIQKSLSRFLVFYEPIFLFVLNNFNYEMSIILV